MIYTDLTIKAMNLAYNAHHGQFDKGGVPYVFHPIHLAEEMDDEVSTCVALLHDTVEDTAVTLEELAEIFPREIVEAVDLLTHRDGVEYFDYVRSIRANPVAVKVKLADLRHNGDPKRISNQGNAEKRREKYAKAWKILTEG
ncbi:MAG: bifunctional (p)ppGpp synthetase/guanosine-3',5'-bis(diphosphate) 3'-pyrophosphohydrolase [Oscillospiraceae bacterium]|nr:bifunctional (p)ppGpp synthetase/guanosine-3',5'-bis(diphosphate) 3'-pyrophosphohydrolase [Oscillospiraceae bacterium]